MNLVVKNQLKEFFGVILDRIDGFRFHNTYLEIYHHPEGITRINYVIFSENLMSVEEVKELILMNMEVGA